ncbi:MAG TPA: flagellar basal body rod C-terminal domain-containing protein, partial [Bryobacteraceae bacterium]|nr:flagellar basal body rod C-terminal domain-containing protein [Bryobacteraceae bacterium]
INGQSFSGYFASLAANVGNAVSSANTNATAQQQAVSQAKSLQQQLSGVSLDQQAIQLVQIQGAYQAASKVVTVIDQITQSLMNMVQ